MILLTILCFTTQFIYGENIEVTPLNIQFNYEPGYANDALDISDSNGDSIIVPEWEDSSIPQNCAYIMGQSNRRIKVQFQSNYQGNMHLIINLTVFSGKGIGTICNFFVSNYDGWNPIELDLSGSLPNSVGKQTFTWKWDIYAIPTVISSYCAAASTPTYTTHTYYTLLAAPQAPMEKPWSSVLEKACVWAAGQSTDENVLNDLTTKLYTISGLTYNKDQTHYFHDLNKNRFIFELHDFLYDWNDADCQDVSMFLSILSSSIGGSLTQTKRIEGFFETNIINPIGPVEWVTKLWHFHQVGWLDNVYDACIQLNQASPYIPINKDIELYKTDLFNERSIYTIWEPQNAFRLGETDPYYNLPSIIL